MPQLGETVAEGTLTLWHKKVGDSVEAGELLFEVSTDKVEVEVPAAAAGIVARIVVGPGETVVVGTVLGTISASGEAPAVQPASVAPSAPAADPPLSPAVRKLVAEHGLELAGIAGTGARGRITKGDVLAHIEAREKAVPAGSAANRDREGRPLSPVVRRLLAEHGLDPGSIEGSGAGGRIKRADVLAFVAAHGAVGKTTTPTTTIPLSRIRRLTGAHMVMSKATSPHVLQAVEVDFHAVEAARAAPGVSLTYLPFIAHAVCRAIADFPHINASIEGDNLVVHGPVNLGIAVDLGFEGLMVPVVRGAQEMSVAELARAIGDLSQRARAKALQPDELAGGTYTLSNSGPYGTLITAPIINQPQVAILSSDGVRKKPVVIEQPEGDIIAIRPVGVLAQSFDHRAFDGAYSAAFLKRLREIIETTDWTAQGL